MSKQYTFWINGDIPSSKNSRVWTGTYFVASAYTRKWIKNSFPDWYNQKRAFLEAIKESVPPYYIEFTFVRKTIRDFDYINILQAPQDQMTHHGWITDDNMRFINPCFGDWEIDRKKPGLKITILKLKPIHIYHDIQEYTKTSG